MIDLHYWPTPNGWKISIMLEECGLPYTLKPVNIGRGEQFRREFLAISPNNRMPAIVDHDPPGGGAPVSVFESGAILIYLAEKTGRFLGHRAAQPRRHARMADVADGRPGADGRAERPLPAVCTGEDPVRDGALRQGGQPPVWRARRAARRAPAPMSPATTIRIADMAIFPWVRTWKAQQVPLDDFAHVKAWYERLMQRPAVRRGIDAGKELRASGLDDEARKALFGQTAQTLRDAAHKTP